MKVRPPQACLPFFHPEKRKYFIQKRYPMSITRESLWKGGFFHFGNKGLVNREKVYFSLSFQFPCYNKCMFINWILDMRTLGR